ncbi:hypothetical protein A2936_00500 [Candidatus Uhrbacteria bacterium RIFCSPLOWO2_01_FULL_47_25]|uniref:Uncharacterized protein n=1 Tax=Candidatus Uhrbacteria bacterium RIFCSPLOWO2_01_FULL_47_25 TaxID=1802402 RepID=A0A1F7UP38_9BACT|nr:MAG: hypothetical protein A2936_00500 [Candidatus Uhrbacteria bacterium RIFCSPLOWO2_01_FULL_47_25]
MATATRTKISTTARLNRLEQEVNLLRSFVIGLTSRDPEGEYNPEFVRRYQRVRKSKPIYRFTDAKSFLKQIRQNHA